MGIFDSILGSLGGSGAAGVGQLVKDVVGTFKLSPEAKAEIEAKLEENKVELAKLDAELQEAQLKHDTDLTTQAAENIRAETTSDDKFTSRARPSFMYIVEAILVANYIILPLINRPTLPLPDALFWLFSSAILGYTGARSIDKLLAAPGDSQIQLPLGIKLGNKS